MSVITAKGKEAKESANKAGSNVDFKKVFVRLKDGESVRVRLLSSVDYVEYLAHGSYNQGIFTQPCIEPTGENCAMCEAGESLEDWKGLRRKKRYLFAFADIDENMVRFFDASKGQAKNLIETIEQYEEDINDLAFVFKRTGTKTDTTYSLSPIIKLKKDDKAKFDKFEGQKVETELYDTVLFARSREQQIEELQKSGFPVGQYFGAEIPKDEYEEAPADKDIEDNPPF